MSTTNVIIPHYSVILADSLTPIIQKNYAFKNEISMELLTAAMNDVYRVDSGSNKYVLRIPRHERFWPIERETYLFEIDLLNFLRKHDFPSVYPIIQKNKQFLGLINASEGIRYFSLFTYAKGSPPDRSDKDLLQALGKTLAKFHIVTDNFQTQYKGINWSFELLIKYSLRQLVKFVKPKIRDKVKNISTFASSLIDKVKDELDKNSSWGVIHGDYRFDNIHVKDQKITLFDFEFSGYGWRMIDLVHIMNSLNYKTLDGPLVNAFLSGYQSIRPLSDNEQRSLKYLSKLILISRLGMNSGFYYLVGSLWFDRKLTKDLKIINEALNYM